jgi:hypothetical protein
VRARFGRFQTPANVRPLCAYALFRILCLFLRAFILPLQYINRDIKARKKPVYGRIFDTRNAVHFIRMTGAYPRPLLKRDRKHEKTRSEYDPNGLQNLEQTPDNVPASELVRVCACVRKSLRKSLESRWQKSFES